MGMIKIICTTYASPDLDGYGCSVAYAELLRAQGEDAEARIWGRPQLEVQWLLEEFKIEPAMGPVERTEAKIVVLDTSDPTSLPEPISPDQVIEVIDHRKLHSAHLFENAEVQIEMVGAAATLVAERFRDADVDPSRESALLLYGGIISNTQNFQGSFTKRDTEMAEWLKELSEAPDTLVRDMFLAKSDLSGDRLRQALIGDSKVLPIQGKVVGTAQLEIIGVDELIATRRSEIEEVLNEIKDENKCDLMFLNLKDLDSGIGTIFCIDDATCELLQKMPNVEWDGRLGKSSKFTLRKQITAWMDENLV